MKHYTSTKLSNAINQVNKKYFSGLNDDDQVFDMIKIDKITKGFSFIPRYDSYELCTDLEKLIFYVEKYGYWSKEVQNFNEVLKIKDNYFYMEELNNKIKK